MTMEIKRMAALGKAVADTQVTISTGKRIQRPSDDPVSAARVATLRRAQADQATWSANTDIAASLSGQADDVLSTASDRMLRVSELMVAGANGAMSQADRNSLALEIRSIAAELDSLANERTSFGQPLFSTGTALGIRVAQDLVLAPVPDRATVFSPGGISVTQRLIDAATALESGIPAQINANLATVEAAVSHVADMRSRIGSTAARFEALQEQQASQRIEIKAERSALEDTDLSEAIALLNAQTITLEAAQAAFARINRQSLFDLLG
jgi:flagellar hook-associated protein 3 FlgL